MILSLIAVDTKLYSWRERFDLGSFSSKKRHGNRRVLLDLRLGLDVMSSSNNLRGINFLDRRCR